MHVGTAESTDMYLKSSGQRYLYTKEGLEAFETLLVQPSSQYLVLAGFPSRAKRFLQIDQGERPISGSVNRNVPFSGRRSEMKGFTLEECVSWDVKELAAGLLKIDKNRLTDADNLADFGFDSISLAEFASSLSAHYGIEVTPALFFGHSTLEKVVRYFLTEHKSVMEHVYEEKKPESADQSIFEKAGTEKRKKQRGRNKLNAGTEGSQAADSIAIIGMSGRFPQARTADELWDILFQEKDVVAPVAKKASQVQNGNSALYRGRTNSTLYFLKYRRGKLKRWIRSSGCYFRKRGGPLRTPATAPVTSGSRRSVCLWGRKKEIITF